MTALAASVRVGGYSLEVGGQPSSFAQFEPKPERENAQQLKAALGEEVDERPAPVAAVEDVQEGAAAVTHRIEQADQLLRNATEGRLLELRSAAGEIDSLLDLLSRLDREGRFAEELRLMRSLNGLLVLALRWYDLVRSLRRLLSAANAAGDTAAKAWAHHELGSLHLCAGEAEAAAKHLGQALRLEEGLADAVGRCATRHNLDCARRDGTMPVGGGGGRPRLLRLVGLATVVATLGAAGTGIAFAIRGGGGPSPVAVLSNTSLPTISGSTVSGETLSADHGRWSGTPAPSFEIQWLRCDSSGAACAPIASASGPRYLLTADDIGRTLRVRVIATNQHGQGRALSAASAIVTATPIPAPRSRSLPTISGSTVSGETLSADHGRWSGTPAPSFEIQWLRCDSSGAACAPIASASGPRYLLTADDIGRTLRVRVIATNQHGQGRALSAASAIVTATPIPAPRSRSLPTISGSTVSGETLSADHGRWSGTPAPSFEIQWLRCDSSGAACAPIASASGPRYLLTADDIGRTLRVRVIATNQHGQGRALSAASAIVTAALVAPDNSTLPTVDGKPVGKTNWDFSATTGAWSGSPPLTYSYQWQTCDGSTATASCKAISGETSSIYHSPTPACNLRVVVTASNAAGTRFAESEIYPCIG